MKCHFLTGVGKTIQKILMNANLVKIIQCRNSYERRIVHMLAEEYGLEHKKILMNFKQKKLVSPRFKNGRLVFKYHWDREQYYDDVYGVQLFAPLAVRREPELRKKLAREILSELIGDSVVKIVCQKI